MLSAGTGLLTGDDAVAVSVFTCEITGGGAFSRMAENCRNAWTQQRFDTKGRADALQDGERYFAGLHLKFPLSGQIQSAEKRGLPAAAPPAIQVLLFEELTSGFLMGVQDADQVKGALTIARLPEPRDYVGMRGGLTCKAGELVCLDEEGVIASVVQGPDAKTAVRPDSRNLLWLAFGFPGKTRDAAAERMQTLRSALSEFGAVSGIATVVG